MQRSRCRAIFLFDAKVSLGMQCFCGFRMVFVWFGLISAFFKVSTKFSIFFEILSVGPLCAGYRWPMQAHAGPRRSTQVHAGPRRSGPRRSTQVHAGPRRSPRYTRSTSIAQAQLDRPSEGKIAMPDCSGRISLHFEKTHQTF